jgi:hypothetical protein
MTPLLILLRKQYTQLQVAQEVTRGKPERELLGAALGDNKKGPIFQCCGVSLEHKTSQKGENTSLVMFWKIVALSTLLVHNALAVPQAGGGSSGSADFLRFGCSQLVVERTDPLVNPGLLPSPHMHQIVGGNSFNISMDPDSIDPPKTSTCTSCMYTEDTSNYWTASIYFKSPENGTYKRVPQMANGRLNNTLLEQDGGLTVYYMRPFSGTKTMKMTAMRPVSLILILFLF